MSRRSRALAAAAVAVLHIAFFAPELAQESGTVGEEYRTVAEGTLDGLRPYSDLNFEYPPFALPLMLAPAALTDDRDSYGQLFASGMLATDLAIIFMLAFAPGRGPRWTWAVLAAYTAGIVLLGLRVRPGTELELSELVVHRFDLVPAGLVLAAALARRVNRTATWSALLGFGTAVKAFPAALFPAFAVGERHPGRAVVAALVPLAGAAAFVLALGDDFWSAITYHADRDLQIETLGASLLLVADLFGADARAFGGSGSVNIHATGAHLLRVASIVAMLGCYVLVVRQVWMERIAPLEASVLVLAPLVILAPVLSPQFLIWLLPVSAAVYGLRAPNLVLIAACALSGLTLGFYSEVFELGPRFVTAVLAKNVLLLVYLWLVLAPVLRGAPASARRARPAAAV